MLGEKTMLRKKPLIIEPINNYFGAQVSGIDLTRELSIDEREFFWKLFEKYHVIVFKDQIISEKEQIRFTEYFGELESFPEVDKTIDSPKTYHVANVTKDGVQLCEHDTQVIFQKVNQLWHTDSSYRFIPSVASVLYGIETLPAKVNGGETEFANMFLIYDDLSEELKSKLEPLHMVHYYEFGRVLYPNLPSITDFEKRAVPPVSHPLIRVHPERSKRKSLYFTANAGNEIGGMSQGDGENFHKQLVEIVSNSKYRYKHRWENGDLVMWDNRCLLHRAIPYEMGKYKRVLRRTTVGGRIAIQGPFLKPM